MGNFYLVIVGDTDNRHHSKMIERMRELGTERKILDNLYTLIVSDTSDISDMEKVRTFIAGEEKGYCFVITVNKKLSCAWSLQGVNSEYLINLIKSQTNEEK